MNFSEEFGSERMQTDGDGCITVSVVWFVIKESVPQEMPLIYFKDKWRRLVLS